MSGIEIFGWITAMYIWLFANPLVAIIIYLIPIIIAAMRKHKNTTMIVILGLFFGWIFLLWLILTLWAAFGEKHPTDNESLATPDMTEEESRALSEKQRKAKEAKARAMSMYTHGQ
ncbi:superinfection immunity protein [Klebsiella aerogenes]|uniref:superinfection immunity protein n=1 Tax=Klebsiella aerogenes TaxID=548 RepID=UPI001F42CC7E|nr:superinfection immunity protein [Klebsiella aerogenes]